jgi:hypothetical protein
VAKAIGYVRELTVCDMLYVGGARRRITFALPSNVKTVSNTAGTVCACGAGVDELFRDEPMAQEPQP